MLGIYFSGTDNSRYAVELFCNVYDKAAKAFSIEDDNKELWKDKKIFVIATMGLFSGDEKVLKRPLEKNKELVKKAEKKIKKAVQLMKSGNPTQEEISFLY